MRSMTIVFNNFYKFKTLNIPDFRNKQDIKKKENGL